MAKKKTKKTTHGGVRNPPGGRPPIYGERVAWLIHVPVGTAQAADKRIEQEGLTRVGLVNGLLTTWLEDRP